MTRTPSDRPIDYVSHCAHAYGRMEFGVEKFDPVSTIMPRSGVK
jgi:hypothetical protein